MTAPISLISFGYLHLPDAAPPAADRVEDVRARFRDPAAAAKGLLDLDGHHPDVRQAVLDAPGAEEFLEDLQGFAESLPADRPRSIAIGCAGGRHRSCALTEELAARLRAGGHPVDVEHRHVHLPRVVR